jgi:hypothetical protein
VPVANGVVVTVCRSSHDGLHRTELKSSALQASPALSRSVCLNSGVGARDGGVVVLCAAAFAA